MARQKACLVQEPCDSVHLDHVLDVVFLLESLLGNLELPMAVELPLTPGYATWCKAAAEALEVVDRGVEEVAPIEVLLLLNLGSQRAFGRKVLSLGIEGLLGGGRIEVFLTVEALEHRLVSNELLISSDQDTCKSHQRGEQTSNIRQKVLEVVLGPFRFHPLLTLRESDFVVGIIRARRPGIRFCSPTLGCVDWKCFDP